MERVLLCFVIVFYSCAANTFELTFYPSEAAEIQTGDGICEKIDAPQIANVQQLGGYSTFPAWKWDNLNQLRGARIVNAIFSFSYKYSHSQHEDSLSVNFSSSNWESFWNGDQINFSSNIAYPFPQEPAVIWKPKYSESWNFESVDVTNLVQKFVDSENAIFHIAAVSNSMEIVSFAMQEKEFTSELVIKLSVQGVNVHYRTDFETLDVGWYTTQGRHQSGSPFGGKGVFMETLPQIPSILYSPYIPVTDNDIVVVFEHQISKGWGVLEIRTNETKWMDAGYLLIDDYSRVYYGKQGWNPAFLSIASTIQLKSFFGKSIQLRFILQSSNQVMFETDAKNNRNPFLRMKNKDIGGLITLESHMIMLLMKELLVEITWLQLLKNAMVQLVALCNALVYLLFSQHHLDCVYSPTKV